MISKISTLFCGSIILFNLASLQVEAGLLPTNSGPDFLETNPGTTKTCSSLNFLSVLNPYLCWTTICYNPVLPRDGSFVTSTYMKQSPINIDTLSTKSLKFCDPLEFDDHDEEQEFEVKNIGTYLEFELTGPEEDRPVVKDGPLKVDYFLKNIHIHTSLDPTNASEHALDNIKFDAEMHAVYGNSDYVKRDFSANKRDAIFVVAVFLQACQFYDVDLDWMAKLARSVVDANSHITLPPTIRPLNFHRLIEKKDAFVYEGSSTVTAESENFNFYVLKEPLCVSSEAIDALRHLKGPDGNLIQSSIRALQPVNDRTIYYIPSS